MCDQVARYAVGIDVTIVDNNLDDLKSGYVFFCEKHVEYAQEMKGNELNSSFIETLEGLR